MQALAVIEALDIFGDGVAGLGLILKQGPSRCQVLPSNISRSVASQTWGRCLTLRLAHPVAIPLGVVAVQIGLAPSQISEIQ